MILNLSVHGVFKFILFDFIQPLFKPSAGLICICNNLHDICKNYIYQFCYLLDTQETMEGWGLGGG